MRSLAWLQTAKTNPQKAMRAASGWIDIPYPLFKQLAFFAAAQGSVVEPSVALEWLLSENCHWLWSGQTMRETIRLIVKLGETLSPNDGATLQEAIIQGPPMKVSDDDLSLLDKMTRVEHGRYTRKNLRVVGEDGRHYKAVAHAIKNPIGKSQPSREYMSHMIKGAKEHNFPKDYIESFKKWSS